MYPYLELTGVEISLYQALYFLGFFIAFELFRRRVAEVSTPARSGAVLVATVAGAAVGTYAWTLARAALAPWGELGASGAGLFETGTSWQGGFVGGALGLIAGVRVAGIPLLFSLDSAALAVPAGQVLGRVGCFLAGDGCYGRPTDSVLGVAFPRGLIPTAVPVHPTALYEAVLLVGVLAVLLASRRVKRAPGWTAGLYLMLASAVRFALEPFRMTPEAFGGLTEAQAVCLVMFAVGAVLLWRSGREPTTRRASGRGSRRGTVAKA